MRQWLLIISGVVLLVAALGYTLLAAWPVGGMAAADAPILGGPISPAEGRSAREPGSRSGASPAREEDRREQPSGGGWVKLPWGLFAMGGEAGCWLSGRITDERGAPIPGAEVIVRDNGDGPFVQTFETTKTDAQGLYRLGPFTPGLYIVSADAPGHAERELRSHPISSRSETLDLQLRSAVLVRGVVVDEDGQPVAGVSLFLLDPAAQGRPRSLDHAETLAGGTFSLDAPHPGEYRVKLSHMDFLEAEEAMTAPAQDVRLVLRAGASIAVEVVDATGQPVSGSHVELIPSAPEGGRYRGRTGFTDEEGRMTLRGLEPGRQTVVASTPADQPARTVRQELELQGSEQRQMRLQFEEGLQLSGVVVDSAGQPVAGAEMRVTPAAMVGGQEYEDPELAPIAERLESEWFSGLDSPRRTGPDGRFSVPHLRPGTWLVTALKQGYSFDGALTGRKVRSVGPLSGVLVEAGASDVRLVLMPVGYVRGRLVHADGSPIARFQLNERLQEDERGEFRWPISSTGEELLAFAAPGLAGTVRRVPVRKGVDVELGEVVLKPGRSVRVRVVDADTAEPVVGARLDLRDPADADPDGDRSLLYRLPEEPPEAAPGQIVYVSPSLVQTEGDGRVTLPNVEARPLLLHVEHADYLEARLPLGTEQTDVTVTLRGGAWLEGEVRAGGRLVESGAVTVKTPEGRTVDYTPIRDGTYAAGPLEAGRYYVEAEPPFDVQPLPVFLPKAVEVPAAGSMTLDLEAQEHGASVELHATEFVDELILIPGQPPLPGSREQAWRTFAFAQRSLVKKERRVIFHKVPAGRYTLFAVRDWNERALEMHREEVEIPDTETVSLELQPRWVPITLGP
jgi:protocatechuate 3,4-dioxygenase beta subunit